MASDLTILEDIAVLHEYVRGSRRPYMGIRWTRNDPLGRIERRVRERSRVYCRNILRSRQNRKVRAAREREKMRNAPSPLSYFNRKFRQ